MTADGFGYDAGDKEARFTIQSVSKAIVYGLALEDWGHDEVLRRIGVEPSGDPFNSITFDESNNRPFNPMVNAGAIAAAALIKGRDKAERRARMLATFERFVGHPVDIDVRVYRSEIETGHRNRAIAYLELNAGMIEGNVEEHLDLYFLQCSILVTARDLAVMAATLANGGINPVTGERALRADHVRDVLSVMTTCGMYDFAGGWQFNVGLPAKSGVGGGIMAVQPGQLGIGVFSPLLDASGNSVRGVHVCRDLSQQLCLHMLAHRGNARTVVRRSYRVAEIRSKRQRRAQETALLDREGHRIVVYELQGDLSFPSLESLTRRVIQDLDSAECFILDARRMLWLDAVAGELLGRLAERLRAHGRRLVICELPRRSPAHARGGRGCRGHRRSRRHARGRRGRAAAAPGRRGGRRRARSWPWPRSTSWPVSRPPTSTCCAPISWPAAIGAGEVIVTEGEPADRLYLITRGRAEISVAVGAGRRRLGTIEAGNVFGELALFSGGRRTAT